MNESLSPHENENETDLDRKIKKALEDLESREIVLDMVAPRRNDFYEKERQALETNLKNQITNEECVIKAKSVGMDSVKFGYIFVDRPIGTGYVEIRGSRIGSSGLPLDAMTRINIPLKAFWSLRGDTFNEERDIERSFKEATNQANPEEYIDPVRQLQREAEKEEQGKNNLANSIDKIRLQTKTLAEILRASLRGLGFEDADDLYKKEWGKLVPPPPEELADSDRSATLLRNMKRTAEENTLIALSFKRKIESEGL